MQGGAAYSPGPPEGAKSGLKCHSLTFLAEIPERDLHLPDARTCRGYGSLTASTHYVKKIALNKNKAAKKRTPRPRPQGDGCSSTIRRADVCVPKTKNKIPDL